MLNVELWRKFVERENKPSRTDIDGYIKRVSKKLVAKYKTRYPIVVGDIIRIGDDENVELYRVNKVIHQIYKRGDSVSVSITDEDEETIICEVAKVPFYTLHEHGNISWEEHIPEVCDIEDVVN